VAIVVDHIAHERVTVPLREVFRTAIRETDTIDAIRIEVRAGTLEGIGYATATPAITGDTLESIEAHINGVGADLLLGAPIGTVEEVVNALTALNKLTALSPSGTAGLDLALNDLLFRDRSAAQTTSHLVTTSVTISAGSAEAMTATAQRRVAAGFTVIKAKLGLDPDSDLGRLIAIARAIEAAAAQAGTAVELWVDANQGWTAEHAVSTVDRAIGLGVDIARLEQPTKRHDIAGLAEVRTRLGRLGITVAVVADEAAATLDEITEIGERGAADIVNVKLMKFGGLTGSRAAIQEIRRHHMGVLIGSMMEHPHSVAAAVSLATEQVETVHDLDAGWWASDTAPLLYSNGTVCVAT
jgi:L-Ala-D/L-Glu epimerase